MLFIGLWVFPAGAENLEAPLTIQGCIRIALERNLAIKSAEEEIRASLDRRWQAGAEMLPKFSAQYSGTRFNEDRSILTGTDFATSDKLYELQGIVDQPIFRGGYLLYSYQITGLQTDSSYIRKEITRQDLIFLVYNAYFNILKAYKLRDVAEQAVKALEGHRNVAREFYNVGMIPKNDLLKSEVELANAVQDLTRASNNVEVAESTLNTILRQPLNTPLNLKDKLEYKPVPYDLDEASSIGLKERPEIQNADISISISNKGVQVAKSGYFPKVSITYNYNKIGEKLAADDDESWSIIASAKWSFFEWGKVWKQVDEAERVVNQAQNNKEQVIDNIKLEVKEAFLKLKEAEKNIVVAQKSIEQAEEGFRISQERYKEQVATSIEVLDAQTLLTQARTNYFNALSDYNLAKARLERAMGRIG